jgi:O-antigen/teichoic acid export membrane protein
LSLKKVALQGSAIVMIGFGSSQVIRLAGNLILTRMLYPELFGIMALISAILSGINLFSDVGIRGGLINSDHSEDPDTYNTAWTMQILRGLFIFLVVALVAYPLEAFYAIEGLAILLLVTGTSALINGFVSTSIHSAEKSLKYARTVSLQVGTQIFIMLAMIALSWAYQSIWVLVGCSVLQSLVYMAASHLCFNLHQNRIHWNKAAFSQLFHFGKWIMISTAAGYITMEADKLIIGKYFSAELLGIYTIALALSRVFLAAAGVASGKLLFPLYRSVYKERGEMAGFYARKIHLAALFAAVAVHLPLVFFADPLIDFLYDDRYQGAAWMLQLLALAGITGMLNISARPILLANADSFSMMKSQIIRCVIYLVLMYLGVEYFGLVGVLFTLIITPLLSYPFLYYYLYQYGYRGAWYDLLFLGGLLALVASYWVYTDDAILQKIAAAS